jgi:D-alanine-D-alanine ligase
VIAALRQAGYDVVPIMVGDDLRAVIAALEPRPDAVFNALHGRFGEDGAIQGVLDWLAIPYTHSGVRASALAMDKAAAKAVFAAAGLPVAQGRVMDIAALEHDDPLPLPYVIKPVNEGSSVGVEIMRAGGNRRAAVVTGWRFGAQVMVEEFIPGRELTVGVMGDHALRTPSTTTNPNTPTAARGMSCRRRSIPTAMPRHSTWRWPRIARWAAAAPRAPTSATTTPPASPAAWCCWK